MKLIHAADLHLGSRLTSLPTQNKIRDKRKDEVLSSFNRLIDYAKDEGINNILLSGDVFDSDRPTKKDKQLFYGAIRANSDITFYYLKGNHDILESLEEEYDNLKLFNDQWTSYDLGEDIIVSGLELSKSNKISLYSSLSLDKNKFNIVMLHGDINTKGTEFLDIKKLSKKNIDYLALGHIHSYSENRIDDRGIAIYPGCLEGRGFDELGIKGFVLLDINSKKINYKFIPFSKRIILEERVDISQAPDLYKAKEIVKDALKDIDKDDIVKVILNGRVTFDILGIESSIEELLNGRFFYFKVESELRQFIDPSSYKNDLSLRGEFVRGVNSNNSLSDELKEEVLNLGIKLLNNEEV